FLSHAGISKPMRRCGMVVDFYASCFLTVSQSSTATTLRWCFALNRRDRAKPLPFKMDSSGPWGFAGANKRNPRVRSKFIAPCYYMNKKLADKIAASDYYVVVSNFFYGESYDPQNTNRPLGIERLLCMPLLLVLHAESLISISILWYRLKPLPGSSGINKSGGSSEPSTIGVRNMLASEQECGSLHRDHIAEQKVVVKGSN
ncbi:hypothetical protein S245_071148, partial [Arachis hypogaea]